MAQEIDISNVKVDFEKIDNVNATLAITLEKADCEAEVKKQLKHLGQTRTIKGFRPGHVPMGFLKKMFGNEVLANVVDRKVSRALSDYVLDNKINILGEPMLSKDTKVDLNEQDVYSFKFDLGLAPEFEIKLDKRVKVPYYNIEVSEQMVQDQHASLRKRYAKQVDGEEVAMDSLLRGSLTELDEQGNPKEGGVEVETTVLSPQYLKDDDEKQKFIGKKIADDVVYNPFKAVDGNLTELASLFNVDKEEAEIKSDFRFRISSILVNEDAEVNQEFFDQVLGKDVAKTEEEYFEKLKEMIAGQLKNDSNYRFTIDAQEVLMKKVGKLEMPEAFLKRFIMARNHDLEESKVDEEMPRTADQLRWQLVKEKLAEQLDVKAEEEDINKMAKFYVANQFAQYGLGALPDDILDKYAKEQLENEDFHRQIVDRVFEDKLFAAIKNAVGINEKNVSVDEFNKLFEEKK